MLDRFLDIIAPHSCVVCTEENSCLHQVCVAYLPDYTPQCFRCGANNNNYQTCAKCRPNFAVETLYVCTQFKGRARQLVTKFKFAHARAAYRDIGAAMAEALPTVMPDFVIVPVPSASSRVRERGFDHTSLLARQISSLTDLSRADILQRTRNTKQVGAARQQRLSQQQGAFRVSSGLGLPKRVLLVDDVATTGATLAACARTLRKAGVRHVYAVVFAKG